jgi:hypothetical protein
MVSRTSPVFWSTLSVISRAAWRIPMVISMGPILKPASLAGGAAWLIWPSA